MVYDINCLWRKDYKNFSARKVTFFSKTMRKLKNKGKDTGSGK
jgi:hypothetical protein